MLSCPDHGEIIVGSNSYGMGLQAAVKKVLTYASIGIAVSTFCRKQIYIADSVCIHV
jgi:hypothetical protein